MSSKKNNSHFKNDLIFILALLITASVAILYFYVFRQSGNAIKVTVDGKLYDTYSLFENVSEDIITGEDNNQRNRLIIKDGKAYIEEATCPDGICASHRPIFRDEESIVCLPNRIVVSVFGNSDNSPDITS